MHGGVIGRERKQKNRYIGPRDESKTGQRREKCQVYLVRACTGKGRDESLKWQGQRRLILQVQGKATRKVILGDSNLMEPTTRPLVCYQIIN